MFTRWNVETFTRWCVNVEIFTGWHKDTFPDPDVEIFTHWYIETFTAPGETVPCWDVETSTGWDIKTFSFISLTSSIRWLAPGPRYRHGFLLPTLWWTFLLHSFPAAVLVPPWRSPLTVSIHAYGILHLPAWRCYLGPGGCATPTWAGKKHCGSTCVDKIWGMNTPVSSPVSGWTLSPRGSMLELSPRHPQW